MNYPTFNPENPEAFEELSWRTSNELPDAEAEAYSAELEKFKKWKRAKEAAEALTPLPSVDDAVAKTKEQFWSRGVVEGQYFDDTIRNTAAHIRSIEALAAHMQKVGDAVKNFGYSVLYRDNRHGGYKCHESRANAIELYKDNQCVGKVTPWYPNYRRAVAGWEVQTNRYSKPNRRWHQSGGDSKYFKKLESAVDFIAETAVPKHDVEAKLKQAYSESERLNGILSSATGRHRVLLKGGEYRNGPDGLLEELLLLIAVNKREEALEKLDQRLRQVNEVGDEVNEAKKAFDDYRTEILEPLQKRAAEELPEFYG